MKKQDIALDGILIYSWIHAKLSKGILKIVFMWYKSKLAYEIEQGTTT